MGWPKPAVPVGDGVEIADLGNIGQQVVRGFGPDRHHIGLTHAEHIGAHRRDAAQQRARHDDFGVLAGFAIGLLIRRLRTRLCQSRLRTGQNQGQRANRAHDFTLGFDFFHQKSPLFSTHPLCFYAQWRRNIMCALSDACAVPNRRPCV